MNIFVNNICHKDLRGSCQKQQTEKKFNREVLILLKVQSGNELN